MGSFDAISECKIVKSLKIFVENIKLLEKPNTHDTLMWYCKPI